MGDGLASTQCSVTRKKKAGKSLFFPELGVGNSNCEVLKVEIWAEVKLNLNCQKTREKKLTPPLQGGGSPYNGLYGEAPPEREPFNKG